jgi:cytochrome b561/polyisoprenoid-binding protein YceI
LTAAAAEKFPPRTRTWPVRRFAPVLWYKGGMWRNSNLAWGAGAKGFHWLLAVLILAQVALGLTAKGWRLSPTKLDLFVWHKSLGILILALVGLRLAWRLANPVPGYPPAMPAWEGIAARFAHFLLYLLMLALPFSGWIIQSASDVPFRIFWQLPLPALVGPSEATTDLAKGVHFWLFVAIGVVLAGHIGAALRHHFLLRDDVLRRMLFVVALMAFAPPLLAADWRMDAAASRLEFIASFEKNPAPGIFKTFDVKMSFDAEKPQGGSLDVSIQASSADMKVREVNDAIRGPEWFDFARFPQAGFRSTDLRRVEQGRYVARGTLTLKGVQQAVEVPFTWSGKGDAALLEGELTVKRATFGIGTGEWAATDVIGPDVKIRFRVSLRK